MSAELTCCVYGIRAKNEAVYFYVGSTRHSVTRRFKAHLQDAKTKKHCNKHFQNKVRLLGLGNVVVDTLESVSTQHRFEAEYSWINKLLREGHPLTNHRLSPWPHEVPELTPAKFARQIFEALLAPEICEIPENQALYSACRQVARKTVLSLLKDNKVEILHFLRTGEMPA